MIDFQNQMTDRIQTNAPSIRYEGDLRPEQAQVRQRQAQAMQMIQQQMQQQQGMMQPQMGQPQMPQPQPQMPQPQMGQPQMPQGIMQAQGRMPAGRMPAAYGGVMGQDGRRQYGLGSWWQEKIMDPIKNNKALAATIAALGVNQFGIPGTGGDGVADNFGRGFIGDLLGGRDSIIGEGGDYKDSPGNPANKNKKLINLGSIMQDSGQKGVGNTPFGLSTGMLSTIGGAAAGLFSDRLNQSEDAEADRGVGIGINNIGKSANLLSPKQGMEAGLRFLPELSTRKYSPMEMAAQFSQDVDPIATANLADGGSPRDQYMQNFQPNYEQNVMDPNMMEEIRKLVEGMQAQGMGKEQIEEMVTMQMPNMTMGFAEGGGIGSMMEEESEMLDMGGMEKDYREEGGFVPIGEYEKKDDVPARLSVNEFVFTADAVRGAGDGDIDKGAERLQGIMKELEKQGKPEGMEMMEVSERLSEVV